MQELQTATMAEQRTDPAQPTGTRYRVLDLINTHECAKELLAFRVAYINGLRRYEDAIGCSEGPYVRRMREQGHTVHVLNTPRNLNPIRMVAATWRVYRFLRANRFDLLHTHTSVVGCIGRVAGWLARVPVVIHHIYGFHHHLRMSRLKRWVFIQAERGLGWLTDELMFENQADIDECIRWRMAPRRKLLWVGSGVQLGTFDPECAPERDPPIILCVGRFEPVKNHMMALRAAEILRDRGVRFRLDLVGSGILEPTYRAHVAEHQLQDHVRFLGYRDDVPALIGKASMCILVSFKEGWPRAIMEAAAGGRPAVATDVVGTRDTLVDGQTGFLVPLNDAGVLADRIEQLLGDEPLRRQIGKAGREHAGRNFDERVVADRILAAYDRLLGAPRNSDERAERSGGQRPEH